MFRVQKNFVHHRCIAPKTGGAVRIAVIGVMMQCVRQEVWGVSWCLVFCVQQFRDSGIAITSQTLNPKPKP